MSITANHQPSAVLAPTDHVTAGLHDGAKQVGESPHPAGDLLDWLTSIRSELDAAVAHINRWIGDDKPAEPDSIELLAWSVAYEAGRLTGLAQRLTERRQ